LTAPVLLEKAELVSDSGAGTGAMSQMAQYHKFTSQKDLGHFLVDEYKIRTPKDLTSCEVCHR